MAKARNRSNGDGETGAKKSATALVGEPYLTTQVDVIRDGKIVRVPGGRMVGDLDESLTEKEMEPLEKSGAIRPATLEDAQASLDATAKEEATEAQRDAEKQRATLNRQHEQARLEIAAKHDTARDDELRELSAKQSEELEALNQKLASGK